ncbi:MAG: hypothetical protein MUF13_13565, partial [Akkermansiaceae bacterium]|nr:hypothetical protein [Akkermansiaceae bacterium]
MPEGNHVVAIEIVHCEAGALHALGSCRNYARLPSMHKRWRQRQQSEDAWQVEDFFRGHGQIKVRIPIIFATIKYQPENHQYFLIILKESL